MSNFFVYVLLCADKTLYCGYTDDVTKRLNTHNAGKGAKYTKARLPVKLLTSVPFSDKTTAMQCEWWFKHRLTRKQKDELLATDSLQTAFETYQKTRTKSVSK